MGYYSRVVGRIELDPPLRWSQIRDSKFLPPGDWADLVYEIAEESTDTDDGTVITRSAVAIVPGIDDTYKAYDIGERFAEITAEAIGHGAQLTGYIARIGEASEAERYVIDGTAVRAEVAKFLWPDGTEVDVR